MALVSVKGSRSSYVLRTLIQAQDADQISRPQEESSQPADDPLEPEEDDSRKRESILFGGVGLSIGIALGGIALLAVLLIMRRKASRSSEKGSSDEG